MPAAILTPTKPGAVKPEAAAPLIKNAFVRAAHEHTEPFLDTSTLMTTSSTQIATVDIAPFGWLRGVWLIVSASGGVGGAATVTATEDAPWSALQNVTITDTNGTPLFGPLDGYDAYLVNKWTLGPNQDPVVNPAHAAVATGAGASGSFTFMLYLPVEASPVDGFCSLPNTSAASTFKLAYTVAPASAVYGVAPATTLPTVRVRASADCYEAPSAVDTAGVPNEMTPPFAGSSMYTSRNQYNPQTGTFNVRFTRVGNFIRSLILINRVAGSRATGNTNLPPQLRINLNKYTMHNVYIEIIRTWMRNQAELAPDAGVLVLDFTHDGDGRIGAEMRSKYLATSLATALEVEGTWGAASTLTVITQDVAPKAGLYPTENY